MIVLITIGIAVIIAALIGILYFFLESVLAIVTIFLICSTIYSIVGGIIYSFAELTYDEDILLGNSLSISVITIIGCIFLGIIMATASTDYED